jgi:hypothetical protein
LQNPSPSPKEFPLPTAPACKAAQLGLAFAHGRPVERSEIVQVNLDADSSIGIADRLKNSPAPRKALRGILDSIEGGDLTKSKLTRSNYARRSSS